MKKIEIIIKDCRDCIYRGDGVYLIAGACGKKKVEKCGWLVPRKIEAMPKEQRFPAWCSLDDIEDANE